MSAPAAGPIVGMAVIGSSGHGARVAAPVISGCPAARLVGVLGSAPGRADALAARHPGCRPYAAMDELLADPEVHGVWITAPNHLHVALAEEALEAGKDVLLEKPMATRHADAERLGAAVERTGRCLRVGFHHRFRGAHRWLHDAVRSGRFGGLRWLRIRRFWAFPYYPDMREDVLASWRMSAEHSGGWVLNDLGSHLLDLALWLGGAGTELLEARTANLKFEGEVEDSAILVLGLVDGGLGTIEVSNAVATVPSTVELHGTDGWARCEGTFEDGGILVTDSGETHDFRPEPPELAYRRQLEDFVQAIHGEHSLGADHWSAAANVGIIERATRRHAAAVAGS